MEVEGGGGAKGKGAQTEMGGRPRYGRGGWGVLKILLGSLKFQLGVSIYIHGRTISYCLPASAPAALASTSPLLYPPRLLFYRKEIEEMFIFTISSRIIYFLGIETFVNCKVHM